MPKRTGRPWTRTKAKVIRRDAGICHLCDQPGANTADHLTPVAHGGAIYDLNNLAAAHTTCNMIRGVRPINDVRAELAARNTAHASWTW